MAKKIEDDLLRSIDHAFRSIDALREASTIDQRIKAAREYRGLSQADLAKALKVSPAAVAQWELDKTHPSADKLSTLAVALRVSYEWLATGRGEAQPESLGLSQDGNEIKLELVIKFRPEGLLDVLQILKQLTEISKDLSKITGTHTDAYVTMGKTKVPL